MEELFKDIEGYNGRYQIGNKGTVLSVNHPPTSKHKEGTSIKKRINTVGYEIVGFKIKGKSKSHLVHRLIAQAFIPNPQGHPIIHHKDSNRRNNEIENLEWTTQSKNIKHSYDIGNSVAPLDNLRKRWSGHIKKDK